MSKPDLRAIFGELSASLVLKGVDALAPDVAESLNKAIVEAYAQGAELRRELPTLPVRVPLSVDRLAKALLDNFELDSWGDIDPYLFNEVIEPVEDSDHADDAEALRAVLQRTVDTLNKPAEEARQDRTRQTNTLGAELAPLLDGFGVKAQVAYGVARD